ncbi:unnamed protein product, partial [marine sediment metagenome]
IVYEAATADIGDINMIDPFHLQKYDISAVNYNRDIENFPILKSILERIGTNIYKSPTDMAISKTKDGILDDSVIVEAAKQEVIRRYFRYKKENLLGIIEKDVVDRTEKLMLKLGVDESYRKVVLAARDCAEQGYNQGKGYKSLFCGTAIEIDDGKKIITGKNSPLLHSESAAVINSLKHLALVPDNIHLIPEDIIQRIRKMKRNVGGSVNPSLDVSEMLIALSVSIGNNSYSGRCIEKIPLLNGCEIHTTHIPNIGDEEGIRNLKMNLTTDALSSQRIYLRT